MRGKRIPHRFAFDGIELKWCYQNKHWVAISQFCRNRVKWDGLANRCKSCKSQSSKRYRRQNRISIAKYAIRYYHKHKVIMDKQARRWRRDHPEKSRERCRQYRVRKSGAKGNCLVEQWQARWNFYGGLCYLCGRPATLQEHVIPLKKGGTNWPVNLRPACVRCNSIKTDKWPYDIEAHRQREGYYDKQK